MIIIAFLLAVGGTLDILLTGFSLANFSTILAGAFLLAMKMPLGEKLFPEKTGINQILSKVIITLISVAVVLVPMSFAGGIGSGKSLNAVLKKSAALISQGKPDQAYRLLDEYPDGENFPEILQNKAAILIQKGDCQKAESMINQATAFKNMDATMLFNLGLCYFQKGHYKDAVNEFEKAILLDPAFWKAYCYAGESYYRIKNNRSAEYFFEEALKINSQKAEIIIKLAEIKMEKMAFSEVVLLLKQTETCEMTEELKGKAAKLAMECAYYVQ